MVSVQPLFLKIYKNKQLIEVKQFHAERIVLGSGNVDLRLEGLLPSHAVIQKESNGLYHLVILAGVEPGVFVGGQQVWRYPLVSYGVFQIGYYHIEFWETLSQQASVLPPVVTASPTPHSDVERTEITATQTVSSPLDPSQQVQQQAPPYPAFTHTQAPPVSHPQTPQAPPPYPKTQVSQVPPHPQAPLPPQAPSPHPGTFTQQSVPPPFQAPQVPPYPEAFTQAAVPPQPPRPETFTQASVPSPQVPPQTPPYPKTQVSQIPPHPQAPPLHPETSTHAVSPAQPPQPQPHTEFARAAVPPPQPPQSPPHTEFAQATVSTFSTTSISTSSGDIDTTKTKWSCLSSSSIRR